MAMTGNFAGLEEAVKDIGRFTQLIERARKLVGEALLTQVRLEFRESRDPYGTPWAPLKVRDGKPLEDTGRLRASFEWEPYGKDGVRLFARAEYGSYHQTGTRRIPARPMLPTTVLPPAWAKAIEGAFADALRQMGLQR